MTGTPGSDLVFINEHFNAATVTPAELDMLLADGWRHFGTHFFRYSLNIHREEIVSVIPLRIRLSEFRPSSSQRRVIRKNVDLEVEITPTIVTAEIEELFHRHKRRFDHSVPDSIYDFLSDDGASCPTCGHQVTVRDSSGQLLAVSFFDIGETAISAIYACFDPNESSRSLGIFTMLKVIEYAIEQGKTFYYHGYSYDAPSFYDYKFRFSGLEAFDWDGGWKPARESLATSCNAE
ncbi:MAG: GNAT family N-acetyltransferase [Pyrinomonadaceae bacterium]|nr:GNAT family N-acetyltransferase [Pyrinomonadaceae bacterium]